MGILSAVSALNGLFGGLGNKTVTLGPIQLQSIQKPARMAFGGKQALTVHKLIGGGRVVNAMGRDDMPLAWDGILEGATANRTALTLDGIRISGQPITLAWDIHSFTVVVEEFTANYERRNWIPYSVSCVVVRDNSDQPRAGISPLSKLVGNNLGSAISNISASVNQVAQTASDVISVAQNDISTVESTIGPVASVFGIDIGSRLQGITSLLGQAQNVSGGLSAIANAPNAIAGAITSLQAAGSQVVSTLSGAETAMAGVVGNAGSGIVANVGDLFTSIGASSTIAGAATAAGYLNTAGAGLASVAPGGETLFAAAGSPLANALDDPNTTSFNAGGGVTYTFWPCLHSADLTSQLMPQTIQTSGGNLFALAAKYYGDATMWWWIAQFNGLSDPMLPTTPFSITIPDLDPTTTGGVPPQ